MKAKPRDTGRFGNLIFEYVFWYLLALQYGLVFENKLKPFPYPFDTTKKNKLKMDINFPFKLGNKIPDYPMDMKYYINYRGLIRNILNIPQITPKNDIVIHIRLDDVFDKNEPLYSVMPLSYYKKVFENIQRIHGSTKDWKIVVVGRTLNETQSKIFSDILETIKLLSGSPNVFSQNGSMSEDLMTIMSSKILIGSTSSFWTLPSFIGSCSEIHIPNFGQAKAYKFMKKAKEIRKGIYLNRNEDYNVYIYDINIRRKILITELNKMYDINK